MQGIRLLCTRRRIAKLSNFLEAAIRTCVSTPGLILVEKKEYEECREQYDALPLPNAWKIIGAEGETGFERMKPFFPELQKLDWIGTLSDDLVPLTYYWDQAILEVVNGKNVVSCDDGEQAPVRLVGAYIFSVPLANVLGYHWNPIFKYCFSDNMWEELGRQTGCWELNMDVMVRHDHPFKTGEEDETHKLSYNPTDYERDKKRFDEWMQNERDADIAKIKAFQEDRKPGPFDIILGQAYKTG